MRITISIFIIQLLVTSRATGHGDDQSMHPDIKNRLNKREAKPTDEENNPDYWIKIGQEMVREKLARKTNENIAKNVIFFLGDGMSIPTTAAARVYMGGEEKHLSFDKFPYSGLSKTYCIDKQVADSACSATAYLCGVKANYGTIGVTGNVKREDCTSMVNSTSHVHSIAHYAQLKNKMTGLVTTARVTHASPAGMFAHTAERNWENDGDVIKSGEDPVTCTDIASQLVYDETGRGLNVILGGGRSNFIPKYLQDEQGFQGLRVDNVTLILEWLSQKVKLGHNPEYVWNRKQLLNVDHDHTDYLLGLFNPDHMNYNLKRDKLKEPSLKEMTEAAIKVLEKSKNGYFLFVEAARIDMGHHESQAKIALDETIEFSKAIQAAVDLTNDDDTLIIVTADHAHTMSYSGYAERGNDILGIAGKADDTLPYTTLNYANGPGYKNTLGDRYDVTNDNLTDADYRYPAISPLIWETHGGDDVAIYAKGPWAHLFSGVMEQNVIPHLIAYASCVGYGITVCDDIEKLPEVLFSSNKEARR